jgi:hypothetical protein
MDKLLTIWPAYAPSAFIVSLGLAMRTLWDVRMSQAAIWFARCLFVVMVVDWQLTTDSAAWIRILNGVFAAIVVSLVFSKILESLCVAQNSTSDRVTLSGS